MEEYAPAVIPIINAKEKYLRVSPPKKKIEINTNNTVATVESDLPSVWLKLKLTVSSNWPIPLLKMFSLILSKITIVS